MTLKKKFETVKDKVKENSPVIIGILTTALAVISTAYIHEKTKSSDEITLEITRDDLEALKTGDSNMTYHLDGELFDLSCRGKNPTEEN